MGVLCLMCSELKWRECHRQVLAQRLEERAPGCVKHIGIGTGAEINPESHPASGSGYFFPKWLLEGQGATAEDGLVPPVCTPVVPEVHGDAGLMELQEQTGDGNSGADVKTTKKKKWGRKNADG